MLIVVIRNKLTLLIIIIFDMLLFPIRPKFTVYISTKDTAQLLLYKS